LISDIDLFFVLPVVEGELVTFELFHVVFSEREVWFVCLWGIG
jgi:hypothetical protein